MPNKSLAIFFLPLFLGLAAAELVAGIVLELVVLVLGIIVTRCAPLSLQVLELDFQ